MTTKYLAKFQSPRLVRAITRPKIIGLERNVNLICNLSFYTHIPNIKSISMRFFFQLFWLSTKCQEQFNIFEKQNVRECVKDEW